MSTEEGDNGEIVVGAGELLLDLEVHARRDEGGSCSPPFSGFWRFACESSGLDFKDRGFVDLFAEEVGFQDGVKVGGEDKVWVDSSYVFFAGGPQLFEGVIYDSVLKVVP